MYTPGDLVIVTADKYSITSKGTICKVIRLLSPHHFERIDGERVDGVEVEVVSGSACGEGYNGSVYSIRLDAVAPHKTAGKRPAPAGTATIAPLCKSNKLFVSKDAMWEAVQQIAAP